MTECRLHKKILQSDIVQSARQNRDLFAQLQLPVYQQKLVFTQNAVPSLKITLLRITSYNVCYTKLLRIFAQRAEMKP